jgi:hypothetical protein
MPNSYIPDIDKHAVLITGTIIQYFFNNWYISRLCFFICLECDYKSISCMKMLHVTRCNKKFKKVYVIMFNYNNLINMFCNSKII